VAQASSWWQQVVTQIKGSPLTKSKLKILRRLHLHRLTPPGWLLGVSFVTAMLLWNWQLLLATAAGVSVMLLVYFMQKWDWQVHWSSLRRLFSGTNRQLTVAVGSGGIAAFSTFMAVSVWTELKSPWMAAGAILQGFGTLATVGLLLWQSTHRQINRQEVRLNQMLAHLTDSDPLKRLIAVRQLSKSYQNRELDPEARRTVADYFCLMLSRESEPVVRDGILEGLQILDASNLLNKPVPPLVINPNQKGIPLVIDSEPEQSTAKVHRYNA
jgi:hypothetical protein